MLPRILFAAATAAAALSAPAFAADMGVPPPAYGQCEPPPRYLQYTETQSFHELFYQKDEPRLRYVEPYDPYYPPPVPTRKYVPPQPAYLASTLCGFGTEIDRRSWYDGKIFYEHGGEHARPDTFMIIERK